MRSLALVLGVTLVLVGAAPAQDKDEKTTPLHAIEKNGGAHFGDWVIWRYDEGEKAIFIVNQKTGLVVFLPWSSNGWVNFRPKDGEWQILFSKGDAKKQNRDDLMIAGFLKRPRPDIALENGKTAFKDWVVTVTKDSIEFHCSTYGDKMTVRRSSGEAVHNGRTIGKK